LTKKSEKSSRPSKTHGSNSSGDESDGEEVIPGESENDSSGGKPSASSSASGEDEGSSPSPGSGPEPAKKKEYLPIRSERAFSSGSDGKSYTVSFVPEVDGVASISLVAIGEVGADALLISSAISVLDELSMPISNGVIGPVEIKKDEQISLRINLVNPIRCAMGVVVNGN